MILGKLWKSLAAQMNKIANFFWTADPIAQLQYEYDKAVDQMKDGREGLEKYRALVERVNRQVEANNSHVAKLEAQVKAYLNNVTKIEHAVKKLEELKRKIQKYDAELKMSRAEAELAKLATQFNFDVTTDFGQIEDVIHDKIDLNRAKVRVAADLSGEGLDQIKAEQAVEKSLADDALRQFEVEMGMVTPETSGVTGDEKEIGSEKLRQTNR